MSHNEPLKNVAQLIGWLEKIQTFIADARIRESHLAYVRGALEDGYRWRRFFTQSGSIPDLSTLMTTKTVESRLVELIVELKAWLKTPSQEKSATEAGGQLDKPEGMPTGNRRILRENIIMAMGTSEVTDEIKKKKGKTIAGWLHPQNYNTDFRTALRQLSKTRYCQKLWMR